jgi:hypothetical protein
MAIRKVTKTGGTGIEYTYVFDHQEEIDQLELKEVLVKGQNIIEIVDREILQDAYNKQYHEWIMTEA